MSPGKGDFRGPEPRRFHRLVAAAVEGDREALIGVLDDEHLEEWVLHHRMAPALFVAANDLDIEGPGVEHCRAVYQATAMRWTRLRAVLSRIGRLGQFRREE